ncbi:peptidoglycan-binding domain-containing protein [Geosporobacter ferrireducens]|uniref:Peptidoglycan binding-like domain-containing protein n=1 Tax=Geosporobacter ferrireducens TaxID=1424294 RepID=A0A1D8GL14_9FIRM|nr:peptidoglycan-binding protein [Geosporobacter ferrireducens]AOT71590.1 hypothetical protein Gferi_19870 [Geosporobacter ferrireducens]MTI55353.1 peptidoglycan-binding protein [Geosporobacter ferrireducens]
MKRALHMLVLLVFCFIFTANAASAEGYTFSNKVYRIGTRHNDVKVIQEALRKDGSFPDQSTTTYFGPVTEKAVKSFQRKYGLKEDGVVGASTLKKIQSLGLVQASTNQVSRSTSRKKTGQYLDWWSSVSKTIKRGDVFTVEDLATGKTFRVKMTAGTNHADVETMTKQDTAVMKNIWGGFSWNRRPVLVHKDNQIIAASMTAMPHAGVEGKPAGQTVSNRSGGYGRGYNYDFVKGNDMSGHVDIHFKNSKRHKDNKPDPQHQQAIKKAAGL